MWRWLYSCNVCVREKSLRLVFRAYRETHKKPTRFYAFWEKWYGKKLKIPSIVLNQNRDRRLWLTLVVHTSVLDRIFFFYEKTLILKPNITSDSTCTHTHTTRRHLSANKLRFITIRDAMLLQFLSFRCSTIASVQPEQRKNYLDKDKTILFEFT